MALQGMIVFEADNADFKVSDHRVRLSTIRMARHDYSGNIEERKTSETCQKLANTALAFGTGSKQKRRASLLSSE